MKKALIFFTKAPRPGHVKTRLQPPLSPEEAASLYQSFVMDLVNASDHLRSVTRVLACDPVQTEPFFQTVTQNRNLQLINQRGRTLGQRMQNAFQRTFRMGFRQVVIIGTDSPTLPMDYIRKAFKLLDRNKLVIGPSIDGGYYLIACSKIIPTIFKGIAWGSDQVLSHTLHNVIHHKIQTALLPFWYDVDTIGDLKFLSTHLEYLDQISPGKIAPRTMNEIIKIKGLGRLNPLR